MQTTFSHPIVRDDTLLGVCQSLGEDFGFNPNFLRVALGVSLLWNPVAVVAAYAMLAVLLAAARWILPDPRNATRPDAEAQPAARPAEQDEAMPLAA
jgi:phage shock protein C